MTLSIGTKNSRIMIDSNTKTLLQHLASCYETPQFIVGDPSWWMHHVQGTLNQEATAFVASALSYGSRSQFMPKIETLLGYAGGDMHRWLADGAYADRFRCDDAACFYRLYNCGAMRAFFDAYGNLLAAYGSLGEYVRHEGNGTGLGAVEAICRWFATHGASTVVPKDATSSCKRVCMFLRWMVRDGSPVDLGLWKDIIDRRTLIMPMDTHVLTEAMKLGLLQSRSASMSAALKLSAAMREVFPDDPLRGDFALFGYGVG